MTRQGRNSSSPKQPNNKKPSQWPETRFYQALSLAKLGQGEAANKIFDQLVENGRKRTQEQGSADFFAKFGQEQSRRSQMATAHYLIALGLLGKENKEEARKEFATSRRVEPESTLGSLSAGSDPTIAHKCSVVGRQVFSCWSRHRTSSVAYAHNSGRRAIEARGPHHRHVEERRSEGSRLGEGKGLRCDRLTMTSTSTEGTRRVFSCSCSCSSSYIERGVCP